MKKLAAALVLLLSGCAMPPPTSPALVSAAEKPLMCDNTAQCNLYWSRAEAWVAQNSYFRIQTVTDSIIQTYGPGDNQYAYSISRLANADGSARIKIVLGCGSHWCAQNMYAVVVSFKDFVMGV